MQRHLNGRVDLGDWTMLNFESASLSEFRVNVSKCLRSIVACFIELIHRTSRTDLLELILELIFRRSAKSEFQNLESENLEANSKLMHWSARSRPAQSHLKKLDHQTKNQIENCIIFEINRLTELHWNLTFNFPLWGQWRDFDIRVLFRKESH